MTRNAIISVVSIAWLVAAVPTARGYESQCRDEGEFSDLSTSVCYDPIVLAVKECDPGLDAARGVQWGEHTLITVEALILAGLQGFQNERALPDYFGTGESVGGTTSIAPADASVMLARVQRGTTIPEMSQLPDVSYGVADFILGNEHCLSAGVPRGSLDQVTACHDFSKHMGAVNSTHFPPQSRAIYERYHNLALELAARCKQLSDSFPMNMSPQHVFVNRVNEDIRACERQALAIEAVAAHYLEDAWSSGHMWERWGSPEAATGDDRYRQLTGGLVAGMLHGMRSVVRKFPIGFFQHDQLNLPGPFSGESEIVEWVDTSQVVAAGAARAVHPGGGDLYYPGCTAWPAAAGPNWSISGHPSLTEQKGRMLTCVAQGFGEVYDAGPRTAGGRSAGPLAAGIPSPLSPKCWGQRVTNASMYLGLGISGSRSSRNKWVGAWITMKALSAAGAPAAILPVDLETDLRRHLGNLSLHLARRAHHQPSGTDAAELRYVGPAQGTSLGFASMLGFARNSTYEPLISGGKVSYLDGTDSRAWSALPGVTCLDDDACPARSICARVRNFDGSLAKKCVPQDGAIANAFRRGQLAHWCEKDRSNDLYAAAVACRDNAGPAACDACVALVWPHVRNAFDQADYQSARTQGPFDPRSACDKLQEANAVPSGLNLHGTSYYTTFDPTGAQGSTNARLAVECLCKNAISPGTYGCGIDVSPGSAVVAAGATQQFTASTLRNVSQQFTFSVGTGTIDGTGLYTAPPAGTAPGGRVTVTARHVVDTGLRGRAYVQLPCAASDFAGVFSGGTTSFVSGMSTCGSVTANPSVYVTLSGGQYYAQYRYGAINPQGMPQCGGGGRLIVNSQDCSFGTYEDNILCSGGYVKVYGSLVDGRLMGSSTMSGWTGTQCRQYASVSFDLGRAPP